jgi:hypothetical protein
MDRRNLPVPPFTTNITNGILTITTSALQLSYVVGKTFNSNTLSIKSVDPSSAFKSWFENQRFKLIIIRYYGMPDKGNLLGTYKSLDELSNEVPLNCTLNRNVQVHDELLHCEWGLISR